MQEVKKYSMKKVTSQMRAMGLPDEQITKFIGRMKAKRVSNIKFSRIMLKRMAQYLEDFGHVGVYRAKTTGKVMLVHPSYVTLASNWLNVKPAPKAIKEPKQMEMSSISEVAPT